MLLIKSSLIQIAIVALFVNSGFSQGMVNWESDYVVKLSDFQSSTTEINPELSTYGVGLASKIDFQFSMTRVEFMFTKNFNSKVNASFTRDASYLNAISQEQAAGLVRFGQLQFDLTELSARKFRKRLYEGKGAFSGTDFFQSMYDKVAVEQSERMNVIAKSTNMGEDQELLQLERNKVLKEIKSLSDYCKSCKPPKRKKK